MAKASVPDLDLLGRQVCETSLKACRAQVLTFAKVLKEIMLAKGVAPPLVEDIVREGFLGYRDMEVFTNSCSNTLRDVIAAHLQPSNRGLDPLGRVLVEFCFVAGEGGPLLHPDGSEADEDCLYDYVEGSLPRPLVRYFLVAVRGSADGVDAFDARPVLFSPDDETLAEARGVVERTVAACRRENAAGRMGTDWGAVYRAADVRAAAARVVDAVIDRAGPLGAERFLKILENIRKQDPEADGVNAMGRHFRTGDAELLLAGLERGRALLAGTDAPKPARKPVQKTAQNSAKKKSAPKAKKKSATKT